MILNVKELSKHVAKHHLKMDKLVTAFTLVTPGCGFLSSDFTNACYSISIALEHKKLLRFQFDEILFEYTAIPNGLTSGPRLFMKVLKVQLAHFQEVGVIICLVKASSCLLFLSRNIQWHCKRCLA